MQCLIWNLEWASPASKRGRIIKETVCRLDPNVVCYTEALEGFPSSGYTIAADADYGYSEQGERRKAILWSKTPWSDVDHYKRFDLPSGRIISGVTQGIRFVGVCIPWKDAHVRTGRKDREPWEDHMAYCRGLGVILAELIKRDEPICVLGDYNQRIPRVSQPDHVELALLQAIPQGFRIVTKGITDAEGNPLIDHAAVSPALVASVQNIIPRFGTDGTRLSDHVGILLELDGSRISIQNAE